MAAGTADAWRLMVRTCWHGDAPSDPSRDLLELALALAAANEVEAVFVRAYADRLPDEARVVDRAVAGFRRNLGAACALLDGAGVVPVLIKATPSEAFTYSNFDVVVGDDGWDRAVAALRPWAPRSTVHPLERATKVLLYPPDGPAVHLHRSVAWFDVPALPAVPLRLRARPAAGVACLIPDPVDALRILLAHAVFQNLALTLGELLTYRDLATRDRLAEAAGLARSEGWGRGFRDAVRTASVSIDRLDRTERTQLPMPLPIAGSLVGGMAHAVHVARHGDRTAAVRELLLRGPLVLAKRRHTVFR